MDEFALKKMFGLKVFDSAKSLVKSSRFPIVFNEGNLTVYKVGPVNREHYVVRRMVDGVSRFDCDCGSEWCEHSAALKLLSEDDTEPPQEESDDAILKLTNSINAVNMVDWIFITYGEVVDICNKIMDIIEESIRIPDYAVFFLAKLHFKVMYSSPDYINAYFDALDNHSDFAEAAFNCSCADTIISSIMECEGGYWGVEYLHCVSKDILRRAYEEMKGTHVDETVLSEIAIRSGMGDEILKDCKDPVSLLIDLLDYSEPGSKDTYRYGWMLMERADSVDAEELVNVLEDAELYDLSEDFSRYMFLKTLDMVYFMYATRYGTYSAGGLLDEAVMVAMERGSYTPDLIRLLLESDQGHVAEELIIRYGTKAMIANQSPSKLPPFFRLLYEQGCARALSALVYDLIHESGNPDVRYYFSTTYKDMGNDPIYSLTSPSFSEIESMRKWISKKR